MGTDFKKANYIYILPSVLTDELRPPFKYRNESLKNMDKVSARGPVAQTLEKYQHIFNPWPAFVKCLQQLKDT